MLDEVWESLCPPTASVAAWRAVFADLAARYREPHRHYHDLEHLAEMTTVLEGEAARLVDRPAVLLATFFHDAVLIAGARDNEARSAALARIVLGPLLAPATVARVEALVLATAAHDHDRADADRTLLVDADLAILAAPPARFAAYDRAIRAEYGHLPAELYDAGRRKFLASMLARPAIFADPVLAPRLEPAARANLTAALADATSSEA